ncbi:Kininogen-1 [Platysternon megacephalum]|uniref:Histidine-rich glycoprotein n=1 Tax=Platysternon megacephalum TaxID=55544 RepID=A0A4D9DSA9_9SAUR|nr:Kininogen-1 [Platysternon megacephalum]
MKLLSTALCLTLLLCSNAQSQTPVTSADCDTVETDAGVALDLINKHRRDGYIFTLFRVADAHEQQTGNSSVLYLTLDVLETQCSVLSRRHWEACKLPQHNEMVFGQCKTIMYINRQLKKEILHGYNCTVSPDHSQLYKCEHCPGRPTALEDIEQHRGDAERALERYNEDSNHTQYFKVDKVQRATMQIAPHAGYFVEFTIKETCCSKSTPHANVSECEFLHDRHARVGFCMGKFASDTKNPDAPEISCEIYGPWVHHTDIIIMIPALALDILRDITIDAHHLLKIGSSTLKDLSSITISLKRNISMGLLIFLHQVLIILPHPLADHTTDIIIPALALDILRDITIDAHHLLKIGSSTLKDLSSITISLKRNISMGLLIFLHQVLIILPHPLADHTTDIIIPALALDILRDITIDAHHLLKIGSSTLKDLSSITISLKRNISMGLLIFLHQVLIILPHPLADHTTDIIIPALALDILRDITIDAHHLLKIGSSTLKDLSSITISLKRNISMGLLIFLHQVLIILPHPLADHITYIIIILALALDILRDITIDAHHLLKIGSSTLKDLSSITISLKRNISMGLLIFLHQVLIILPLLMVANTAIDISIYTIRGLAIFPRKEEEMRAAPQKSTFHPKHLILSIKDRASPLPTQDADCDDPDVFEAVDIALRKYNGDKTDGNQFALYMVMEAKRIAGPGKQFVVMYRIRESSCAVGGDKLWQDCDYRASAEAESGECTAQVYVDKTEKISNVTQECRIIPVEGKVNLSHVQCLGCYHPIPGYSLQLLPILRYAIRRFNNQSDRSSLFEVGEIIKASRQVVAGWNYAVEYEVKETSCTKNNFQDLSPECKPIVGGHVGRCEAKAYVDLSNTIVDVLQKCKFPVHETVSPHISVCAGCPRPIPTNSTELEEPLRASLEKYNEESKDDFYYKAEAISYATVQVVAGKNYNITFRIMKTNCSKTDVKKLNEDCAATIDGKPLLCKAQVYVIPWTKAVHPKVSCTKEENILMRRPPGFTPFRSLVVEAETAQNPPQIKNEKGPREGQAPARGPGKDVRHEPAHEQGHRHDIGCGPEHEHRRGHGHEDEHVHRHDTGRELEHENRRGHGHEDEQRRRHDIGCGPEHEHRRGHGHDDEHGRRHDTGRELEHENRRGHGHEDEHRRRHDIGCGPEHGHGDKHGRGHGHGKHKDKQKKIKDKHKHSKDESSEESHEKVTNQKETLLAAVAEIPEGTQSHKPDLVELDLLSSTQSTIDLTDGFTEISELPREIPDLPAEPDSPGIIPDTPLFDGLPDLPEPSVPKCPGKPWKPIIDLSTTTNKPKVLTNEDLLPHPSADTIPVPEKYTPAPKGSDDFDLTDFLL